MENDHRKQTRILPELRVVNVNCDSLRCVKGISKDELCVLSRAQAGVEQVLGSNGLAQHVGDTLCLAVLFAGFHLIKSSGQPCFLSPTLSRAKEIPISQQVTQYQESKICKVIIQTFHCKHEAQSTEKRPGLT